ncbi:MAG: DNA polymerase Y family protein [Methylibium sp.]|uniref:Y-family DNA polymerase n=1 Tax=Methylibium sp. TaxID=2067992 RepID=UPI0018582C70|nr:DNA polymerase Y family protein [Methylibium sp.]MBA3598060.1 DNA polymerase Y family protein [Methylibium sp.]
MLWIALHLPHLPLQALRWSQPGFEATLAVAVAEQHRLLGVNRAARARGVQTGQSAATALSLAPELLVLPRDLRREADVVEAVALTLGALTPNLVLQSSGVLFEVQGSLRLFGGVRHLWRRAVALAQTAGAQARLALAPTASAAWLLATSGITRRRMLRIPACARQLDRVPVAALAELVPIPPRQAELLQALGVQRVGELRRLPRAGLQHRLGKALSVALDRAYGEQPDPRIWFMPPERFEVRRELLQRADDAAVLVAAVEALLPALRGWLQLQWHAATELSLRLRHEHGREPLPDTVLRLQLSTPSRDMNQLALLWRERLQRHALAAPVYELGLALEASVPHGGTPGELLAAPGQTGGEHAALLDRLVARLGAERVRRFVPVADHRPERAQRGVPITEGAAPKPASAEASSALPRPTWLLSTPQPLASDDYGRPLHGGPLALCSRAERIEGGWFDGGLVRRDYHVAVGADHRLRWIYRERSSAVAALDPGAWFLHGWFG